jgi:hypothetical protein
MQEKEDFLVMKWFHRAVRLVRAFYMRFKSLSLFVWLGYIFVLCALQERHYMEEEEEEEYVHLARVLYHAKVIQD